MDQQIWAHINLAIEAPQKGLLKKPPHLKVIDFNKNATLYIQLLLNQQKAYKNSKQYYN